MTSLATIRTGAEQYAPMAQAIIGGLTSSVLSTIFVVPAAYVLVYGREKARRPGSHAASSAATGGGMMPAVRCLPVLACATLALAQTPAPTTLGLSDATVLALRNHPQVLAAQNEAAAQNRVIVQNQAAYYPTINGEITASGGNYGARIGAGFISDSRLFDRFGLGIQINQLISDFGRTSELVAQSKLLAVAAEQNYDAAKYDVILRVNQAYYNALRAQALVKLAQTTLSARQVTAQQGWAP